MAVEEADLTPHFRHAIANTLIGVVLFYVLGCSALHFSGAWFAEFLPMSDSNTYDNTGARYNTTRVLNTDLTLNEEAYKNYSPLFIRYVSLFSLTTYARCSFTQHYFCHVVWTLFCRHLFPCCIYCPAQSETDLDAVQE